MAGFFENLFGLNLTPQERKALMAQGKAGPLVGALEGEYLPRADGIEADRPRIGSDPVSSQAQSRVGPDRTGRTFYANTAGDVGTSVPKGSGTSGVYGAAEDLAGKEARGLLKTGARTAGKFLGPIGAVADFVNPEAVGDGELTPEQQAQQAQLAVANMGPQMAGDAWQFGSDVAQRTLNAGLGRGNPLDLRDPQAPRTNYFDQSRSPRQPEMEDTVVGPVAQSQPQNQEQAVAAAEQRKIGMQEQVANTSLEALNSGKLTRVQAAEAVVQADAQRSGKELTPEQTQTAVKEEVSQMKGLDNQGLSKYLGIALVAGGLLASVLDKSGRNSQMFADSMNKQMDRELAAGQFQKKQDAAAAKAAQDMKIELLKLQQTSRRNDTYQQATDQSGEYNDARISQGDRRIEQTGQQNAATNAYRDRNLGLKAQGLLMDQARLQQQENQFQQSFGLRERELENSERSTASQIERRGEQNINDRTSLAIRAKAVAVQEKGQLPKLSTKDAEALVDETYSGQGVKLNDAAKAAMAQQLRRQASEDPSFFENPSAAALRLGDQSQYETGTRGGFGWLPGVTNVETRVKKRKTQ